MQSTESGEQQQRRVEGGGVNLWLRPTMPSLPNPSSTPQCNVVQTPQYSVILCQALFQHFPVHPKSILTHHCMTHSVPQCPLSLTFPPLLSAMQYKLLLFPPSFPAICSTSSAVLVSTVQRHPLPALFQHFTLQCLGQKNASATKI